MTVRAWVDESGETRLVGTIVPDPGGGSLPSPFVLSKAELRFTEEGTAGVYTASVDVPAGTRILDVPSFVIAGPWAAGAAPLDVGDGAVADGYLKAYDLCATGQPYDPTTAYDDKGLTWIDPGLQTSSFSGTNAYGQACGLYYGPGRTAAGVRYQTGDTITATLTTSQDSPLGPIAASNVDVAGAGSGYAPGDTGTIQGGATDAAYVVDTVDGGGGVLTYHLTDDGTGWGVGDGYLTTVTTGGGDGALTIDVTEITPTGTGFLIVDVIGWGVPLSVINAVKS